MNPKDKIEKNKNTRQKNIYTTKGKEANTSNEKN